MNFVVCALLGYFVGTVNPAYLVGKIRGFDIRKKGSGNAGASNALILFGKLAGAICAVLDIAKAYAAILLAKTVFPAFPHAFAVASVGCILGHIFPFYMQFKGGKGLACLGGMILAYDWRVLLIMLAGELVVALVTDYICFVPITASFVFPAVYGIMENDLLGALLLLIPALVILFRHLENLRRIPKGTELHLSYLWKSQSEIERIKNKLQEDAQALSQLMIDK